jgi:hypothetical protein
LKTKNKEESHDLDKLLRYSLDHESVILNSKYIQKNLFPDKDIGYCIGLYYTINNHNPELFFPISGSTENEYWASTLAEGFLSQGGFSKIFNDEYAVQEKQDQVNELEIEKLRYDVQNAKRMFKTYWWTFGIAILGFLLVLTSFIISISAR